MTDDELRDKLINDMIQNWITMNNRPVERPDILRGLFEKGWSARNEHIAEHPKVRVLCEAAREATTDWSCPACSMDHPPECVPCECDVLTEIRNQGLQNLEKALKAFEEET